MCSAESPLARGPRYPLRGRHVGEHPVDEGAGAEGGDEKGHRGDAGAEEGKLKTVTNSEDTPMADVSSSSSLEQRETVTVSDNTPSRVLR